MPRGGQSWFPCLVALFLAGGAGCAGNAIKVPVTMPAEIDLKGIRSIAMGEIDGRGGLDLYDALETQLTSCGRFEVVDRQHLEEVMKEKSLSLSGAIDPATATEIGRLLGASALIFGRVSRFDYAENVTNHGWKDKQGKPHVSYTRTGTFTESVTLQVTDLTTGMILTKVPLDSHHERSENATDDQPAGIDRDGLTEQCRTEIVTAFMRKIAPYQTVVQVSFKSSKESPELESGINYAKAGDAEKARQVFGQAVSDHPADPLALFDYAVACELCGRFEEALASYEKAYVALPRQFILEARRRCDKRQADEQRLRQQQQDAEP